MKPFDIEKALAGEPLQCKRTKHKFYFLGDTSEFGSELYYPIVLYNKTLDETTNVAKEHFNDEYYTMWQKPRPRVQLDLPAPLAKVNEGQEVYFIDPVYALGEISEIKLDEAVNKHIELYENGCLFATKEDAQEWLDAMRNARR